MIPSVFLTRDRYTLLHMCSLVVMIRLCCILYLVICPFCCLTLYNHLFIAFNANSACLEIFKMYTVIVL